MLNRKKIFRIIVQLITGKQKIYHSQSIDLAIGIGSGNFTPWLQIWLDNGTLLYLNLKTISTSFKKIL